MERAEAVRKVTEALIEQRIKRRIIELKTEIRERMMKAESGADWAEICSLEVELIGLGGSY